MAKFKDITGQKFGRLTALSYAGHARHRYNALWLCQCDCGNIKTILAFSLLSKKTQSCGCLALEIRRQTGELAQRFKYGRTPEYKIWCNAKTRCFNPNRKQWKDYGGRGITMCQKWRDNFEAFYRDMGPRPTPRHTLDRYPDNNGNCRWATMKEQNNNRRPLHEH